MPNAIHVETIDEVKMHAGNLAPKIHDSKTSTDLTFRLPDVTIKEGAIRALNEIFKRELGETEWDIFIHGYGENEVAVNIIKK